MTLPFLSMSWTGMYLLSTLKQLFIEFLLLNKLESSQLFVAQVSFEVSKTCLPLAKYPYFTHIHVHNKSLICSLEELVNMVLGLS